MANEELEALYGSLHSVEDAYDLMKKNGYTGTMEDFMALCDKAAKDMSMNLDEMEQVAGGLTLDDIGEGIKDGASYTWEKAKEIALKTWDWAKQNPEAAAGIVGGTAAAVAGITYVVKSHKASTIDKYDLSKTKINPSKVDALAPEGYLSSLDLKDDNLVHLNKF